MRKFKTLILCTLALIAVMLFTACSYETSQREEMDAAIEVTNRLREAQPIPTDIEASLERHNIIRRSYWINGMRERAITLPNPIPNPPMGYIILFAPNGGVIGRFMVEGKVTSLNYSLVPYSEYWERGFGGSGYAGMATNAGNASPTGLNRNNWIANPGGVYGTNTNGVFWFTPDGKYMEWNGTYLFSDIPFIIDDPVLRIDVVEQEAFYANTPPPPVIETVADRPSDIPDWAATEVDDNE